ncbi:MAG: acyltransferase [Parvibaculum sp.]
MHSALIQLFRRTTTSGKYYPEIDGLRFIAIALVVLFHLSERSLRSFKLSGGVDDTALAWHHVFQMGDVGVHLFFAISGYIISKPFLDRYALKAHQPFSLRHYYLRRLTRLEPPYIIVMTGIFLFLTVTGFQSSIAKNFNETQIPLWQSYLASLPYAHGLLFGSDPRLNPPAWSLELEIQFYIVAPALMVAYFSCRRAALARFGLIAALVSVVIAQTTLFGGHLMNNKYALLSYVQYFLIGILLCDLNLRKTRTQLEKGKAIAVDITALIALIIFARSHHIIESYTGREIVKLACICLIFSGALHGHYFRLALSNGFVSSVGGMCYSIYLIHMPIMQVLCEKIGNLLEPDRFISFLFLQAIAVLPALLLASAVFFLLVEKPCMQKDWPTRLAAGVRNSLGRPKKAPEHP